MAVTGFGAAQQVLEHAGPGLKGVVVSDIRRPGMDGMNLLQRLRDVDPDLPVIVITGHAKVQLASEADALIVGPTGAGKEVVAQAMHDLSPRSAKPFVAVNCAALPAALIESALFGHEAGAFAGAMRARFGRFEQARGGTVLLDEVGQMPLQVQAKLLRMLQERVITRLGSNDPIPLDVRVIARSKTDLAAKVAKGTFRKDLYWRMNVAMLRVPPLLVRREDIALLFLLLVRKAGPRHSAPDRTPSPEMLADLAAHDWPGNVRELRNTQIALCWGWLDAGHTGAAGAAAGRSGGGV